MVIIASYQAKPASIVGSAVTVLTNEEIEQQKTLVATDLLREIPGIAVSRNSPVGTMTQVRIRGAEATHTKVFIDGIDANNPFNHEFGFQNLMSFDVGQIDVLRGPESTFYGSDAIGGVVNIQTPTMKENGLISRAEVMVGSMNTKQTGIAVTGKSDRISGHFSASRYLTDGISASAATGNNEKDGYSNSSFHGKLGFELTPQVSTRFVVQHTSSHGNYDGFDDNYINVIDSNEQNSTVNIYGLAEVDVRLFNDIWLQRLAYQTTDSSKDDFSDTSYSYGSQGRSQSINYQNTVTLDSGSFNHVLTLATVLKRIKYTDLSPTGNTKQKCGENYSNTETGIISEYALNYKNIASLSISARRDLNNRFNNATTYRTTGSLFIIQNIPLHASYDKVVANPTFYELDFSVDTGLVPGHSNGYDMGIELAILDGSMLTDLTYFNSTIKDEIDYIDNRAEVRRPMHTASLINNYTFLQDKANINIGVIYNGDQWDIGSTRLNDYTLFNAAVSYDITQSLQLFVRSENLFNKKYTEIKGYRSTGAAAYMGFRLEL